MDSKIKTPRTPSGISDLVPARKKPVPVKSSPFPVPVSPDEFDDNSEGTPITDMRALFRKMGRTSKQVENIAEAVSVQALNIAQIPDIGEKADRAWKAANETHEEVIIVRTRQEDMGVRLERIERNGHPCKMEPRVDSLEETRREQKEEQEKDAEARVKIDALDEKVKEVKDARKSLSKTVIGIIVSVLLAGLGSGGSAIWFIRGLQSDLELEVQAREIRDKNLDKQLRHLPTKEQLEKSLPAKSDVQRIAQAVPEDAKQDRIEADLLRDLWRGLSPRQKLRWCRSKREKLPRDLLLECSF